MQGLERIKDMLCEELDEMAAKGTMSAGDLDTLHKLTATIKNIDKIEMADRYSRSDGRWMAEGDYGRNYGRGYSGTYDNGNSYGRHYVRGHYSRDDGRDMMRDEINKMMQRGDLNGNDRNALNRAMQLLDM